MPLQADRARGRRRVPVLRGYWAFLDRNRSLLSDNPRMRRPLTGLDRLRDLDGVREQEQRRGTAPP
jgi:deoxyribodipyrimidine photolyase-related protein